MIAAHLHGQYLIGFVLVDLSKLIQNKGHPVAVPLVAAGFSMEVCLTPCDANPSILSSHHRTVQGPTLAFGNRRLVP